MRRIYRWQDYTVSLRSFLLVQLTLLKKDIELSRFSAVPDQVSNSYLKIYAEKLAKFCLISI